MKKTVLFVIISLLFLSGCSNKKLTCTLNDNDDLLSLSETVVYSFDSKGDKLKKVNSNTEFKVKDEELKSQLNEIADNYEKSFDGISDLDIKFNTKIKDEKIFFDLTANVKNFSNDDLKKAIAEGIFYSGNYDEIKKILEDKTYKCK